jgi:hypothetical protein
MTRSGIEPATFRFVAQYLNHCATAVPILVAKVKKKIESSKFYVERPNIAMLLVSTAEGRVHSFRMKEKTRICEG